MPYFIGKVYFLRSKFIGKVYFLRLKFIGKVCFEFGMWLVFSIFDI